MKRSIFIYSVLHTLWFFAAAGCNAPADTRSADADTLRALHARVIRAHMQSNVNLILADETEDYVVANRGEITRPSLNDRRNRMGSYLERTRFESYVDLVDPVVEVSEDGTMGWVIVQIEAKGVQTGDDGQESRLPT